MMEEERFITVNDAIASQNRIPKQAIPPCPICGDTNIILYGQQEYALEKGRISSTIYRCKRCDFNFRRFSKPMSEMLSHFKVAPYSIDDIEQQWLKRREGFYQFLLGLLSKPADGKALLDIGCAFGHFLDCAAEHGYKPYGAEVSKEMAVLLRRRRDYPISSRPLDDLQLPESKFDVVTFIDSFYYFENPLETLRQCHKLIKPGGELLMRVTNRNGMARLYRSASALTFRGRRLMEMPFWTTDDAISCHSHRSLAKLMNKTGFRIIKLTGLEKGKKIDSFGLRAFYQLTSALAQLTCERICLTPGVVCLATKD
jgi:2-polyprenyl-3-methyl-5-hydroxy-6-metoxy-1,4-benzoquinol methylase